jgi:diguanylate cyclase (GGDEF)-like protein
VLQAAALPSTPPVDLAHAAVPLTASRHALQQAPEHTPSARPLTRWMAPTVDLAARERSMVRTLVQEAITVTVGLVLAGLLLWTRHPVGLLLAGWLLTDKGLETSFQGQLLPYFWPEVTARQFVPVATLAGAAYVGMFTLAARAVLGIGRQGLWAWLLGGLNALALLVASAALFTGQPLLPPMAARVLALAAVAVWPLAAWRTPLPARPGARALQLAFLLCWACMALHLGAIRHCGPVQGAGLAVLCAVTLHARGRAKAQATARRHAEHLAGHDPLTQLPNRQHGRQLLAQAMQDASAQPSRRVGLLCLDLDRFKHVNDTHGHAVGDALLCAVGARLQACLGSGDTICHLAGDEFMAVIPDAGSPAEVARHCETVLAEFSQPFEIQGMQLFVSFSIGAALFPEHALDAEALMRHADTALFESKRAGANRFRVFHPDMNTRLMAHVSTRNALRIALEQQQFELHYQPQIGLKDSVLVGVEALIRWNRPGWPLHQPGDFIAVAEESGLIVPIGAWVLHEACRQASAWRRSGWDTVKMAVNVSTLQFQSGTLVQDVAAALAASHLPPHCLELELTESVLMGDEHEALRTFQQLKALGVSLSIDDFGTGYSNLAYLQRFCFDRLKIDRSFILGLEQRTDGAAIVRAILQMARHLKLRTTAEGVENAATAERLTRLGCDEVQGYHYARPLPAPALDRWRAAFQHVTAL